MAKLSIKLSILTATLFLTFSYNAQATTFFLPSSMRDRLIGTPDKIIYTKARKEETLLELARRYDLGQNQIIKANKDVDRWMPSKPIPKLTTDKEGNQFMKLGVGKDIRIPNSYLLPSTAHKGIVLNLPEYRLYYYRNGQVTTHPISIGRVDWNTPLGLTSIIAKTRNPTWTPPASIRKEHATKGEILPAVFPAGPDNPLGLYAMRLGRRGYLIHSTNKPLGVGMRVSHGCVRMYPEDIERIFPTVSVGTPVYIVNEPIKVGWSNGSLYIESHPDLEDSQRSFQQRMDVALNLIEKAKGNEFINISGAVLKKALEESNGIPVALYKGSTQLNNVPTIVKLPVTNDSYISSSTPSQAPRLDDTGIINNPAVLPTENRQPSVLGSEYQTQRLDDTTEINNPAVLPSTTSQPSILNSEYQVPRLENSINYNGSNIMPTPNANNLPPMPRLDNTVKTNQSTNYSILQKTNSAPPKLDNVPQQAPQLQEPNYSILKSAVPPN